MLKTMLFAMLLLAGVSAGAVDSIPVPDVNEPGSASYLNDQLWLKMSPARMPINFGHAFFTGLRSEAEFTRKLDRLIPGEPLKLTVEGSVVARGLLLMKCTLTLDYRGREWGWLVDENTEPVCQYPNTRI